MQKLSLGQLVAVVVVVVAHFITSVLYLILVK